jgi:hypothetical protein
MARLSRFNPLRLLPRRWFTPLQHLRLEELVVRARKSPDGSQERREVVKRFAVLGLAVLTDNGVQDADETLVRLVNRAVRDAPSPELFSERLWELLAEFDGKRARAQYDLRFFHIQFVHDVPMAYIEPLEQVFIRPVPENDALAKLVVPTPDQFARAYGKMLGAMLVSGERDPSALARRTKNFFPLSRVRKLQKRHESGRTAIC